LSGSRSATAEAGAAAVKSTAGPLPLRFICTFCSAGSDPPV
jgi:hypothetical protein